MGKDLASAASRLGITLRSQDFEYFDAMGALKPVAFQIAARRNTLTEDYLADEVIYKFREESEEPWSTFRHVLHRSEEVRPCYSPWQLLYCDDVVEMASQSISLKVLRGSPKRREEYFRAVKPFLDISEEQWRRTNVSWEPLIKTLVCIQNYYYPLVIGQVRFLRNLRGEFVEPTEHPDALELMEGLGLTSDMISNWYWYMVDRGMEREPNDGLEVIRRALPPRARTQMKGSPARAQINFDAAQMLRFLYRQAIGIDLGRAPSWPLDGRQDRRWRLYERGPAEAPSRAELIDDLVHLRVYPHGVHLIGEGVSEREIVTRLVEGVLGPEAAQEIGFTDLGGADGGDRLETMVSGFSSYAQRTVVIVDRESRMMEWVTGLQRSGLLNPDDILLFDRNLEESNFSISEMLDVIKTLARSPEGSQLPVGLSMEESDVLAERDRVRATARQPKGLASIIVEMAQDPRFGETFRISKPRFAIALADYSIRELSQIGDLWGDLSSVELRPIVRFVLERIVPVLATGRWRG